MLGGGRFGAVVLAPPFWRRAVLAPDMLAPGMGAGHFGAEHFGAAYYIVYFACMENILVWNIWLSRVLNPFFMLIFNFHNYGAG